MGLLLACCVVYFIGAGCHALVEDGGEIFLFAHFAVVCAAVLAVITLIIRGLNV